MKIDFITITNFLSLIASIITIGAAIASIRTLSEVRKYKRELYRDKNCELAIEKLEKIRHGAGQDVKNKGAAYNFTSTTLSHIQILIGKEKELKNACSTHIKVIENIGTIKNDNLEDFCDAITAVIELYKKGK